MSVQKATCRALLFHRSIRVALPTSHQFLNLGLRQILRCLAIYTVVILPEWIHCDNDPISVLKNQLHCQGVAQC